MEKIIQVGWREWFSLPELGIEKIKAKIDTGARTSALHAFFVEPYMENDQPMIHFGVRRLQKRNKIWVDCVYPVHDYREVCDSGGHREMRYVIYTPIRLGERTWPIEMTLTNRDTMKFRMLLGRSAMRGMTVNPNHSYLFGRPDRSQLRETGQHSPVEPKIGLIETRG
jgi:hypothetical protein